MERRQFLQKAALGSALTAVGLKAMAQEATAGGSTAQCESDFSLEQTIDFNHGHLVSLSLTEAVNHLRDLKDSGLASVTLDIQGQSGHPHSMSLSSDQLVALIQGDTVQVVSSEDFGHAHGVTMTLLKPMSVPAMEEEV